MTEQEQQLMEYLEFLRKHERGRARWRYSGPADLLLKHARCYRPQSLPRGFWVGAIKECFRNAAFTAMRRGVRYVEGYASAVIPVHHAWCADADGNVLEVTWDPPGSAYFGCEFDPLAICPRGSVLDGSVGVYKRRYQPPMRARERAG
jgi:hypothetical protein